MAIHSHWLTSECDYCPSGTSLRMFILNILCSTSHVLLMEKICWKGIIRCCEWASVDPVVLLVFSTSRPVLYDEIQIDEFSWWYCTYIVELFPLTIRLNSMRSCSIKIVQKPRLVKICCFFKIMIHDSDTNLCVWWLTQNWLNMPTRDSYLETGFEFIFDSSSD